MPTNTFSLGKDCQIVVMAPNGQRIDFSIVTDFDAKQAVHQIRINPLDGPPQGADVPNGWNGTFNMDRGSNAADALVATIEAGFWAGAALGVGQIFQYINEVNGSQSIFSFNNVTMHLSEAGAWRADNNVKQTISFFASTRTQLQ